jgi:hypothetical protein
MRIKIMTARWAVCVDAAIRPAIHKIAEEEERDDAEMVRRLLREALRARGVDPTPIATAQSIAA